MNKKQRIAIASIVAVVVALGVAWAAYYWFIREPLLDTSTEEAYTESLRQMQRGLDDAQRQRLSTAIKVLAYPQRVDADGLAGIAEVPEVDASGAVRAHGLTARQIIDQAQADLDAARERRIAKAREAAEQLQKAMTEFEAATKKIGEATGLAGTPQISGENHGFFSYVDMVLPVRNGGEQAMVAVNAQWRVMDGDKELVYGTLDETPETPIQPGQVGQVKHRVFSKPALEIYNKSTPTSRIDLKVVRVKWADGTETDIIPSMVYLPENPAKALADAKAKVSALESVRETL